MVREKLVAGRGWLVTGEGWLVVRQGWLVTGEGWLVVRKRIGGGLGRVVKKVVVVPVWMVITLALAPELMCARLGKLISVRRLRSRLCCVQSLAARERRRSS